MNHQLTKRWQESHRGRLHDPASWASCPDAVPSLTYIPTGAGFTGLPQLQRFTALFPAPSHPLAPEQLTRYNNDYRVVRCTVDEQQAVVTEELVISALHHARCDYIMPGVEATNLTYVASIVLVAKYDCASLLLEEVRVHWDQATLLRQLGIFHLAFHNLIKATGKLASFENELEQMPIADGVRVAQRLLHPTSHNSNLLVSLETLEEDATAAKTGRGQQPVRLSPIGGLDNITELAHNLPSVSPKRQQALRTGTGLALENSVFAGELEANNLQPPPPHSAPARLCSHADGQHHHPPHAALTSSLVLSDGSAEPVQPVMRDPSRMVPSPFGEQHDVAQHRPSIAIDPKRNISRVFAEPSSPFHPGVPLTDRSRFESKVFSDSPLATPVVKPNSQLQSHIFAGEEGAEGEKGVPKHVAKTLANARPFPFGTDDDAKASAPRQPQHQQRVTPANPAQEHARKGLEGHFSGSSFSFASGIDEPLPSFSGRAGDPRTNRSSIRLGDALPDERDVPRAAATGAATLNPRMASHNQSQLQLGDNPSLPPLHTSTRVLQPPGGRSSIFLE